MKNFSLNLDSAMTPPLFLSLIALLAVTLFGSASAQLATIPPRISPLEVLEIKTQGLFEVWQGGDRLGTESYVTYLSITGDSLITVYETEKFIPSSTGPAKRYAKGAVLIQNTLDKLPLFYQFAEIFGERRKNLSVTIRDTVAQIYLETNDRGTGRTIAVPEGTLFIFDASIYQHFETLAADFARRNIPDRKRTVFIPSQAEGNEFLELQLIRREGERIEMTTGAEREAVRIEIIDSITLIETWISDEGDMLLLQAPSQKIRVIRLPPDTEKGGDS